MHRGPRSSAPAAAGCIGAPRRRRPRLIISRPACQALALRPDDAVMVHVFFLRAAAVDAAKMLMAVLALTASVQSILAAVPAMPWRTVALPGRLGTAALKTDDYELVSQLDLRQQGLKFEGVGALSGGGGTSRYLYDYPEDTQEAILDALFNKTAGGALQMLKIEIGGGEGCYFLVFVQLFEKYGTSIKRNTALIEKVSPFRYVEHAGHRAVSHAQSRRPELQPRVRMENCCRGSAAQSIDLHIRSVVGCPRLDRQRLIFQPGQHRISDSVAALHA
eukprot:SAG31_NODE_1248_length_9126_cov_5.023928_8_plen_276_part_00